MSEPCKFGKGEMVACKYAANESGYCPRHEMLVDSYPDLTAALAAEHGKLCKVCIERFDEGVQDCKDCGMKDVCEECRRDARCCFDESEECLEHGDDSECPDCGGCTECGDCYCDEDDEDPDEAMTMKDGYA